MIIGDDKNFVVYVDNFFNCHLIDFDKVTGCHPIVQYFPIDKKEILVVIDEYDFYPGSVDIIRASGGDVALRFALHIPSSIIERIDYNLDFMKKISEARESIHLDFQSKQTVYGYKIYCVNANRMAWIGMFDLLWFLNYDFSKK